MNNTRRFRHGPATVTYVPASVSSVPLLQPNKWRSGVIARNSDESAMYLKYGHGASAESHTYKVESGEHWIMDAPVYGDIIEAVWEAAGTGGAHITEL